MSALIEFEDVCKYYRMGDTTVKAADHISMKIEKGEFVAIVGQSGSGKSTCMNIIGCLDVPTAGSYRLNGREVGNMSGNEQAEVRNEMLGFIFQQYNLLPKLNLLENVEVPLIYAGVPRAERRRRAREALEQVGLGDKLKNKAQPAFRRSAAARLHCPGAGRESGGHSGRRAHRRAGQPHRPRGAGNAAAAPPAGQHRGAHHPRQLYCRAGPAHHPAGGWPRGLRRRCPGTGGHRSADIEL
ncbi:hypothetical protein FAEPRAA2165_01859 [Faecalibacterium duncaniae]|uniref:ABC transporter domain-containing protein n=1 Tax=Faecalibacterium duncaniae (strain DSM 17677 / JCM 31915 / A2-165) TaxID=411483 RepID=C7H6C7_FAED2|nr:hypothetical protein FAEPRAA2165_01859 [Faecalibacterium duncaniae]